MGDVPRRYPVRDVKLLWALSAGRCAFPGCRALCIGSPTPEGDAHAIVGDIAHIYPHSPTGPRGDEKAPEGLNLNSYANWILLCAVHHREVDQQHLRFRANSMVAAKQAHEGWIWRCLADNGVERVSPSIVSFVERRSSVRLYRIFKRAYDPLLPPSGLRLGRFDDPFGEFGVLYATTSAEAALAEALAPLVPSFATETIAASIPSHLAESVQKEWAERNHMKPGLVPHSWYAERSIAQIEIDDLHTFRMTDESSRQLSSRLAQSPESLGQAYLNVDFRISQSMARHLYDLQDDDASPPIDGITWASRQMPDESLFALFDRVLERARVVSTQPLDSPWSTPPNAEPDM